MALVSTKYVPNMDVRVCFYLLSVAVYSVSVAGVYVRPPPRPVLSSPSTTTTDMDPEQVPIFLFYV